MSKGRLEAFSDGVIAVIITIMVLELKAPAGHDLTALATLAPVFASYVISFLFVGIYWVNHHHLLQAVDRVSGGVLWANLILLFCLSLIPFLTVWLGDTWLSEWPVACYGIVGFLSGVSYSGLVMALQRVPGQSPALARAIGNDRKGKLSLISYAVGSVCAFVIPAVSIVLYLLVSAMWLIPDRRIENTVSSPAE